MWRQLWSFPLVPPAQSKWIWSNHPHTVPMIDIEISRAFLVKLCVCCKALTSITAYSVATIQCYKLQARFETKLFHRLCKLTGPCWVTFRGFFLVNRQKSSSPLSVGLCRGELRHNPILMHLSRRDWNGCGFKAVCPPENSNWYLLSPVSNHPYDPSLQAPRGLFGLSHFLLCLCLACSLAAADSSSSLSIRCHRLVSCLWLRMIEAPYSSVSSAPGENAAGHGQTKTVTS